MGLRSLWLRIFKHYLFYASLIVLLSFSLFYLNAREIWLSVLVGVQMSGSSNVYIDWPYTLAVFSFIAISAYILARKNTGEILCYALLLFSGGGAMHWMFMHINRFDYYVIPPTQRRISDINKLMIYN